MDKGELREAYSYLDLIDLRQRIDELQVLLLETLSPRIDWLTARGNDELHDIYDIRVMLEEMATRPAVAVMTNAIPTERTPLAEKMENPLDDNETLEN